MSHGANQTETTSGQGWELVGEAGGRLPGISRAWVGTGAKRVEWGPTRGKEEWWLWGGLALGIPRSPGPPPGPVFHSRYLKNQLGYSSSTLTVLNFALGCSQLPVGVRSSSLPLCPLPSDPLALFPFAASSRGSRCVSAAHPSQDHHSSAVA
jgi:hypothetical protein